MSYFPVLENITSLMSKTTVLHVGWSWHSEQIFWRGILESHCAVIICNESIVDRVFCGYRGDFPDGSVFVWADCLALVCRYTALTVTLWEPLKWAHVSSRLPSPLQRSPTGRTLDTSTKTHAAARVCTAITGASMKTTCVLYRSQHTACSAISVQLTWQLPALRNLAGWDIKSLHFQ